LAGLELIVAFTAQQAMRMALAHAGATIARLIDKLAISK
jgi:hypothetical protein